jgi:hypothetical protein
MRAPIAAPKNTRALTAPSIFAVSVKSLSYSGNSRCMQEWENSSSLLTGTGRVKSEILVEAWLANAGDKYGEAESI